MADTNSALATLAGLNQIGLTDLEASQGASVGISTTSPLGTTLLGASGSPQSGSIVIILIILAVVYALSKEGR